MSGWLRDKKAGEAAAMVSARPGLIVAGQDQDMRNWPGRKAKQPWLAWPYMR